MLTRDRVLPMTFYYVVGTDRVYYNQTSATNGKRGMIKALSIRDACANVTSPPSFHTRIGFVRASVGFTVSKIRPWNIPRNMSARNNLLLSHIKGAEVSFRSLQLNSSTPTFQQFLVCNAVCSTSIKTAITFLRFGFFVSTSDSTNRRSDDEFFELMPFKFATWFNVTNITGKYTEASRNVSPLQLHESRKTLLTTNSHFP